MCLHPEAEGVYLPLGEGNSALALELNEHFETKWVGWCHDGIDQETAEFIDGLLAAKPEMPRFGWTASAWWIRTKRGFTFGC
jgi:hypothetical protein